MANFNVAYGLCSVIDSRSLLGLSDDEDGCAVITLGKNMVIRCRISDQKQLNSWSTRLSKLTSHVVYDSVKGTYVGVFDDVHVKQWTESDSSIEKLKKHTLKNEIHEILLHRKTRLSKPSLIILFKNGGCIDLEAGISKKGDCEGILQESETIKTAEIISGDKKFLVLVTLYHNKYHICYSAELEEENYSVVPDTVKTVKLRRQGATMLGHCILQGETGNSLLTYWSDGFLYSLPLPASGKTQNLPGKYLGTINKINKESEVAMVPVSCNQIAIYASDVSDEGAFLGIYNTKFGLFQAQSVFKLFSKPPRIWVVESNVVILMGQRLVCVPFVLKAEALSSVVCSRALHNNPPSLSHDIAAVIPNVSWEQGKRETGEEDLNCPERLKEVLAMCSSEGWSEYGICQHALKMLLEARDYGGLDWVMRKFVDIPEDDVVRMIAFLVNDDASASEGEDRARLLDAVLRIPVNDASLVASLRRNLTFDDCFSLLGHIRDRMTESADAFNDSFLAWSILLVDAFYQQIVLSRDASVLHVTATLRERIDGEIERINELQDLVPILRRLKRGKDVAKRRTRHVASYSLQRIRLYD